MLAIAAPSLPQLILPRSQPLSDYKDAGIAVHANYYLQSIMDNETTGEPLLAALGGYPFSMRKPIEEDLRSWKANGITPTFIFDGMGTAGSEEMAMRESQLAKEKMDGAWKPYYENQPTEAVQKFGKTGAVKARHLTRFFQQILLDLDIAFEVAPYSACAQLAYMDSEDMDSSMGIMGPPELLMYNINESIITKIDTEKRLIYGLVKSQILRKLNVNEDTFIDAFLMTGTSSLPPFPALMDTSVVTKQPYTILDAINMLRTAGKSIASLCDSALADSLKRQEPEWQDKYQKCRMAIKHAIYQSTDGLVEVTDIEGLTEDHHEYLGLQLGPELYHYQNKAVISPRVLNWLGSLKVFVEPPLEGGDSAEYRKLVTKSLLPIQEQAVSLYATKLHRAFQHKNVEMKTWFNPKATIVLKHKNTDYNNLTNPTKQADSWRVEEKTMSKAQNCGEIGTIGFALKSLQNEDFAAQTVIKETPPPHNNLKSTNEVKANAIWRFLHLRGYVNDEHKLTEWGTALLTTIKALPSTSAVQQEEAAVLAFELMRHGVLNAENEHTEWIGGPNMGTPEQNKLCLLISRTACLLPLQHQRIGFTGPLSRNLLAYHALVHAVREANRDLVESVVATMFVGGHAERRERKDWKTLGFSYVYPPSGRAPIPTEPYHDMAPFPDPTLTVLPSLPFLGDQSLALAIAVKHFLDEGHTTRSGDDVTEELKKKYADWPIKYAESCVADMDRAFSFFDALRAGVAKAPASDVKDQKMWNDAGVYLKERRLSP